MAYKPGYSEEHSPTYKKGVEDAEHDAGLVGSCPPWPPAGPQQDGAMYRRGYFSVVLVPHIHDKSCRPGAA